MKLITDFMAARLLTKTVLPLLGLLMISQMSHAAFLEMPDTSEVPEYEEGSMLLDLEVPGVRDRDPDPESGPRLNVKEFRLQGVVEFPDLGITRKALVSKIESLRFELMQEDKQGEGGYTDVELSELADLIGKIEEGTKDEHVDSVHVQQLVFLIREQRRKRGVTLGMIELVADTITQFYREKGFMLAKAYIPKQHVRDGIVTLTLLLGELGKVEVENNKSYSYKSIARVFNSSLGQPVTTRDIEEKIYLINDMPGLSVRGYFQPGSQIGDTELNINVIEEDPFSANIRIDNEGSEFTGEYRAYLDMTFNNPWFIGGQLYLSGLSTFSPGNSKYFGVRYDRNVFSPRWRSSFGYSENAFTFGLNEVDGGVREETTGESEVLDTSLTYVLTRSRSKNYSIVFGYKDIKTSLTVGEGGDDPADTAKNMRLAFNFDIVDDKHRLLHVGNVALVNSKFEAGAEVSDAEDKSGAYFTYDYSMLSFWTLPFAKKESRVLFKSGGQYTGKSSANVNKFSLAGVNRARAFEVNRFYADDAIYFGADLIFQGPGFDKVSIGGQKLSRIIQPFIFLDVGYGVSYALGNTDEDLKGKFSDVGFGFNINYNGSLKGSLMYGLALQEDDGIEPDLLNGIDEVEDTSGKFYFNLQYSF